MTGFHARQILVATDYGEPATAAVGYARSLALRFQSKLTVLHADGLYPPPYMLGGGALIDAFRLQEQRLSMALEEYVKRHAGDVPGVSRILVNDHPAHAILGIAADIGADLIVIGTHGPGGIKRVLIGSVAEQVLRSAAVPVLTVRNTRTSEIRRVLCPVNYSEVAGASFRVAIEVARRFGAELFVLHLVEPAELGELDRETERLSVWVGGEAPDGTRLRLLVSRGDAAEQVARYAKERQIDLLIIGARHQRFADQTVIGTTTRRIIRTAECPVLTIGRTVERTPADLEAAIAGAAVSS